MKRILTIVGMMVVGALAVGLLASHVFAAGPTLMLNDASADVGDEATVTLWAGGIVSPGLGAWSIDIAYDPLVVTPVSCSNPSSQIAVCNPNFSSNSARISGASADGIMGDFSLGTVTFKCNALGSSPLTIRNRDFMDATPADLQPINVTLDHGSIACGVVLPATGSHGPTSGGNTLIALIAALAAFGVVVTGVSGTLLGRRSR